MTYHVMIKAWQCQKCGHVWTNRKPGEPTRCGKCKRWDWRLPRVRPPKKGGSNESV